MLRFNWLLILPVFLGCSGGRAPVPAPSLSPSSAGDQALQEYDTNKDGFLDAKELANCPALRNALKAIDKNKDGRLTAAEISERLSSFQTSGVGMMSVNCQVFLDGNPLPGATVTFTPEKFLGTGIKTASGTTDDNGTVSPQAEGQNVPAMHYGMYRIAVSKKNASGQETIPARFNSQTVLGQEIAPGGRDNTVTLNLSSR